MFLLLFVLNLSIYQLYADSADTTENSGCNNIDGIDHLEKGQKITVPGKCLQATCVDDGQVTYLDCGLFHAPPPCIIIPEDVSKPFPDCCAKPKCGNKN